MGAGASALAPFAMRFTDHLPLGSRLQRAWQRLSPRDKEALDSLRAEWRSLDYQKQIDFVFAIKETAHFKEFSVMEIASMFDVRDETILE